MLPHLLLAAKLVLVSSPEAVLATERSEVKITYSPDGKRMLWGSTDRPGGPGKWDIWKATAEGGGGSQPRAVSFNSTTDVSPTRSSCGCRCGKTGGIFRRNDCLRT